MLCCNNCSVLNPLRVTVLFVSVDIVALVLSPTEETTLLFLIQPGVEEVSLASCSLLASQFGCNDTERDELTYALLI